MFEYEHVCTPRSNSDFVAYSAWSSANRQDKEEVLKTALLRTSPLALCIKCLRHEQLNQIDAIPSPLRSIYPALLSNFHARLRLQSKTNPEGHPARAKR